MLLRSLLGALLLTCSCKQPTRESAPVHDDLLEEERQADGAPLEAPAGAPWTRAWVSVAYRPPERGYHARHTRDVAFTLHVVVDGVDVESRIWERSSYDASDEELARFVRSPPTLRAAPDGHALAVRYAVDTSWRLILVEDGGGAFACNHLDVDPAALPPTRDFLLQLLADPAPHRHLGQDRSPRAEGWGDVEVMGALRWATAHPEDAELRAAWAAYVVRPGRDFPYPDSAVDPILDWLASVACDDEGVREVLRGAVTRPGSDAALRQVQARAVRALARCDDATVQDAFAALLRDELARGDDSDEAQWFRAKVAWSLASVTTLRRDAASATIDTLAALARDATPAYGFHQAARVYAVRALGAVPSPPARAALEAIAEPASASGVGGDWPTQFTDWREAYSDSRGVAWWARLALEH